MDTTLLGIEVRWILNALFIGPDTRDERKKLSFVNLSILRDSKAALPQYVTTDLPLDLFSRLLQARCPLIHDSKKSRRRLLEAAVKLVCTTAEARAVLQGDTRHVSYIFQDAANAFYDKAERYRLEMEGHDTLRKYKQRFPAALAAACPYCIAMGKDPDELHHHISSFHGGLLNYEEDLNDPYFTSTDDEEV